MPTYNLEQIFTIKNIVIYLISINLLGFMLMLFDKYKAKRSMYRTAEKTLLTVALIGGSIGSLIGMYTVRHKTKHARFTVGIPIMLVLQIALTVYCVVKFA